MNEATIWRFIIAAQSHVPRSFNKNSSRSTTTCLRHRSLRNPISTGFLPDLQVNHCYWGVDWKRLNGEVLCNTIRSETQDLTVCVCGIGMCYLMSEFGRYRHILSDSTKLAGQHNPTTSIIASFIPILKSALSWKGCPRPKLRSATQMIMNMDLLRQTAAE